MTATFWSAAVLCRLARGASVHSPSQRHRSESGGAPPHL